MATLQRPGTETTAAERAKTGAEIARMEGKGVVGQAVEAAKNVATGQDESAAVGNRSGFVEPGLAESTGTHLQHHRDNGVLGRTEEELARLRTRSHITHEGDAYCPNPNLRDLPREFETRVTVIQRYPEMKTVEKTDFIKEILHEDRFVVLPKSRIIMDEVERIDQVPIVRQVPRTRIEIFHRVVTEEREVFDMVQEVEYIDIPRIEMVPRVITEDVEERVIVPVVREVPVTRRVEVPTGKYCESPFGDFVNPGHFDLVGGRKHRSRKSKTHSGGLLHKSKSLSPSSSSDKEKGIAPAIIAEEADVAPAIPHHTHGTGTVSPAIPRNTDGITAVSPAVPHHSDGITAESPAVPHHTDGTTTMSPAVPHNTDGTTTVSPAVPPSVEGTPTVSPSASKRRSFLQRFMHH